MHFQTARQLVADFAAFRHSPAAAMCPQFDQLKLAQDVVAGKVSGTEFGTPDDHVRPYMRPSPADLEAFLAPPAPPQVAPVEVPKPKRSHKAKAPSKAPVKKAKESKPKAKAKKR